MQWINRYTRFWGCFLAFTLGCGAGTVSAQPKAIATEMSNQLRPAAIAVMQKVKAEAIEKEKLRKEDAIPLRPMGHEEIARHTIEQLPLNKETVELFDGLDSDGRFFFELPHWGALGFDLRIIENNHFKARYALYDHDRLLASGMLEKDPVMIDPVLTKGPIYLAIVREHGRAAVVIYPAYERLKK